MGEVSASAARQIAAPPDKVFAFLRDYRDNRPRILPSNYLDYEVEEGGTGAGTVVGYRLRAGRRERTYRMRVAEPTPDTLTESDTNSSLVTTWTVRPAAGGTRVHVESRWQGASGVAGFFERRFAPAGLRRIYDIVLDRLEQAVT